jgi:hypothetical protein
MCDFSSWSKSGTCGHGLTLIWLPVRREMRHAA